MRSGPATLVRSRLDLFRAGHLGRSSVEDGRVDEEWLLATGVDVGFDLGLG